MRWIRLREKRTAVTQNTGGVRSGRIPPCKLLVHCALPHFLKAEDALFAIKFKKPWGSFELVKLTGHVGKKVPPAVRPISLFVPQPADFASQHHRCILCRLQPPPSWSRGNRDLVSHSLTTTLPTVPVESLPLTPTSAPATVLRTQISQC
jgi:hypothetical protein